LRLLKDGGEGCWECFTPWRLIPSSSFWTVLPTDHQRSSTMALGISSSEIELRVKLNHLKNADLMSKTDAFVVVYLKSDLRPADGVSLHSPL
jgi:hypothetical protein